MRVALPRLVKLGATTSVLTSLNSSSCFPLLPFLWDWAAPRRTSADLEEGKRAKFGRRRITLAGKKPYRGRRNAEIWSGSVWQRKLIASPGWEGWDTISKETGAPRGHVRRVCELRKFGILYPKQAIRSPNVTSDATGRIMRWRWGWEESAAHLPGWWGWLGRLRGLAGCEEERPSLEERRRVKLGVTRQKGLCQVKQNALPVPGMGPEAAEVHHSSAVSRYPRNPLVKHPVPPQHPSTKNEDKKCVLQ